MVAQKNVFKHTWISRMTEAMTMTHPELDVSEVEAIVVKIFDARFHDTEVSIYNNYENTVASMTLASTIDWITTNKPLIAESGVFFYPKDKKRNINVEIIKDDMLDVRTIHKAEKFQAMEAGDEILAAVKDLQQGNDKKAANSGYGAEGESSSFLYNIHSASSVTSCGRGQISTACQCFENLLEDNVKFFHMTEFFTFVHNVIAEAPDWRFDTFDIVPKIPSRTKFINRFLGKFGHESLYDEEQIGQVYDYLDDEQRVRVYYKANIREFLALRKPSQLFSDIACTKVEFIDPNKIPNELRPMVDQLTDWVMEFVNCRFGVFRYEDRTRYQKRKCTIVIDTDSNFVSYGPLYGYLTNGVLEGLLFRTKKEAEDYKLRVLNVLSNFTTVAITQRLWDYCGTVNIAEEDRKHVNMKNEFYYSRVIVTHAKKSYVGLQKRQEKVVFTEPKLDVKGVNFFKSTTAEATSKFIYDDVLMGQLLTPADGKVSLRRTYQTIYDFEQRMKREISNGDLGYTKRSIRVKTPDGYANPLRIGQYKAVYIWNQLVPDKDRIDLPATVTIVKVQMRNKQDAAALEQWPDIYEKMLKLFDENDEVGDVIDQDTGKLKKGKGIKAIAMPSELDEMPDWLKAIIDVTSLAADNMRLLTQLFLPLGLAKSTTSHNSASIPMYTNIVRI